MESKGERTIDDAPNLLAEHSMAWKAQPATRTKNWSIFSFTSWKKNSWIPNSRTRTWLGPLIPQLGRLKRM